LQVAPEACLALADGYWQAAGAVLSEAAGHSHHYDFNQSLIEF
jgi:hypothetical protein